METCQENPCSVLKHRIGWKGGATGLNANGRSFNGIKWTEEVKDRKTFEKSGKIGKNSG